MSNPPVLSTTGLSRDIRKVDCEEQPPDAIEKSPAATANDDSGSSGDADDIVAVRRPARTLELILATRPILYINIVGQPTITLPSNKAPKRAETWPLRSDRVKAWIAEFIWDETGIVLAEREIDRLIMVLVGKAWHDVRHDVELTEAIDEDPLLEALLIFMHEHAVFDKSCTALMTALDQVARSSGLDTKDRLWPKAAPQLSNRIEQLKPLLQRADIAVEIGRRSGGLRFVRLTLEKQRGGDAAAPPLPPSLDNSHHPTEIRCRDDCDSDSRTKLFDLLRPTQLGDKQ